LSGASNTDWDDLRKELIQARNAIDQLFLRLPPERYNLTSCETEEFNCVGWAAGKPLKWWQAIKAERWHYWPRGVPKVFTIPAYSLALQKKGFVECGMNGDLEPGFEKVALFIDHRQEFSHAARQLPSGEWTSKLGALHDIEHERLTDLEGPPQAYGTVALFLKRPIKRWRATKKRK
jgi:hypothetical protein